MPDHNYKFDTEIRVHVGVGLVHSREDVFDLGELINATQEELDSMSKQGIHASIREAVQEWSLEYIDTGWEIDE